MLGALIFNAILAAPPARASRACAATGPYVVITAPHPAPANVDVSAVIERLREELATRGIELCAGAPPAPAAQALATVRLEASGSAEPGGESVALDIEVRDQVTAKRVGREIDLAGTPADGRGVVVALAADELLRASWAELSLDRAPKPAVPIPPAVRAVLAPPSRSPSRVGLGVRGAGEWWSGGLSLFGADADLSVRVSPRWSLRALGGVRVALDTAAPDGTASARAATFRLGPELALTSPEKRPPLLAWDADVALYLLELSATPTPPARATNEARAAAAFETGPVLHVPLPDAGFSIALGTSFAVALQGQTLLDGAKRVTALSGVAGIASFGVETP